MQIIRDLDFQLNNTAVCIGKFDGIHRGHRLLLEEAKKSGRTIVMFTFATERGVLYGEQEKIQLAAKLGVDVFLVIPFNRQFKEQPAEEFVKKVLLAHCDAKKIIVGDDFRFGYQRSGDIRLLQKMGMEYGFETIVKEKMVAGGDIISSTRIRTLVGQGRMREANALLGTPYRIAGEVQRGRQLGSSVLHTPTANLYPDSSKELPPYGVYAVLAEADGRQFAGVGNLGKKPTIGMEEPVGLEVWLFDYEGNLYGKEITVYLLDFQRPEQKFASMEELKAQIAEDAIQARQTLDRLDSGYLEQSYRY